MPTGYVKKVANKKHATVKSTEEKWAKAKRLAAEQGHGGNYAYVTGIFKKMVGENVTYPTFKNFLILENDLESQPGQRMSIQPNVDDNEDDGDIATMDGPEDMDAGMDADVDMGGDDIDMDIDMGDEIEASPGEPVNLDTDERFLELKSTPAGKADAIRIRQLSTTSPQEVEQELQDAWEKHFGNKGVHMSKADDMHHMGGEAEEIPTMKRAVGESLLASLVKYRK